MTRAADEVLAGAQRLVDDLSARSGVSVGAAATAELAEVVSIFEATWGRGRSPDSALLTALTHAGNPVHLARRDGRVVGAAFAFLGDEHGPHLHSHMAAVSPSERGRGVGLLLKAAQRSTALERGITEIRWTYDPVLLLNARFNLARLGGRVSSLHPDFYGRLGDSVSGDDASDRFEVSWQLDSERTARALGGRPPVDQDRAADLVLPADYHALRAADPAAARDLRTRARRVLAEALATGRAIDAVRTGYTIGDAP